MIELVDNIRKTYNISESYKTYKVYSNIWDMFKKKKDTKVEMYWMTVEGPKDNRRQEVDEDTGIYKGKYFDVVSWYINNSDDSLYFVFTDDIERFNKEFSKKVEEPKGLAQIGVFKPVSIMSCWTFSHVDVGKNNTPILNDNLLELLNKEIASFLVNEKMYKEHNFEYKRGILMYGPPGNGKTSFIKSFVRDLNAMVIMASANDYEEVDFLGKFLSDNKHDKMLKVIIFEDVEVMNSMCRSRFLNLIDGMSRLHRVIFIATTNFPEKLDIGISQRPSRFDMMIEVNAPNAETRTKLIKKLFKDIDARTLCKVVKETEGFSGAYFKEIYTLHKLMNIDIETAVRELKTRFKLFGDNDVSLMSL